MASNRLQRNITYLDVLAKTKPSTRTAIIENADKDLIICLCECALNILNGNIPLDRDQFNKLLKHKEQIRLLASKKLKHADRKEIIQNGGFLPALLAPILGIAGQLLVDAIVKK